MNEQTVKQVLSGQKPLPGPRALRKQLGDREVVRICVVGAGRAGLIHARNIAKYVRRAELVALCDARDSLNAAF